MSSLSHLSRASKCEIHEVFESSYVAGAGALWSTKQNPSGHHMNEDRAFSIEGAMWTESGDELNFLIVGIIDGHGGASSCDLIACSAGPMLSEELANLVGNVEAAFVKTFADLEESCLTLPGEPSGACVCMCLIGKSKVWCANLGDCRAVLYGWDGDTHLLSIDQRSGDGAEYDRIVKAGGAVVGNAVEGLMPSRTLGDGDVKEKCPPGVIIADPEIRTLEAEGLIVLATDGLWDVLTVEDVEALLPVGGKARRRAAQETDTLKFLADRLIQAAAAKNAPDDVTAVVVPVL